MANEGVQRQRVVAAEAWNLGFKETNQEVDSARLFDLRILDKTLKVTMVLHDDVFELDWFQKQRDVAALSAEKHEVCVHAFCSDKVEGMPKVYLFSLASSNEILIWLTRQLIPIYSLSAKEFLTDPNVKLIGERSSEEIVVEYFHEDIKMEPISEVYKERISTASHKAKRLKKSLDGAAAMDVQLRMIQKLDASSSAAKELSMDEVCLKLLGLPLPSFDVAPQLSPLEREPVSGIPNRVAEYFAIKVAVIHLLVSTLGQVHSSSACLVILRS